MLKRILYFLFLLFVFVFFFASCDFPSSDSPSFDDYIFINGDIEISIEAGSKFSDPGIDCPDGYSYVTSGKVDTSKVDRYHLVYSVYFKDGSFVKELHRYVNVVDTTPPEYISTDTYEYSLGVTYPVSVFLQECTDNYDDISDLTFSKDEFVFDEEGVQWVIFYITDSSGNSKQFKKSINVTFDLLDYVKNTHSGDYHFEEHEDYYVYQYDHLKTFYFYFNGKIALEYEVNTELSIWDGIILISSDYGSFDAADISYTIGFMDLLSVGKTNIDILNYDSNFVFDSYVNKQDLDADAFLADFKIYLPYAISWFNTYFNEDLHLPLK